MDNFVKRKEYLWPYTGTFGYRPLYGKASCTRPCIGICQCIPISKESRERMVEEQKKNANSA